jgi:hypothetical protein
VLHQHGKVWWLLLTMLDAALGSCLPDKTVRSQAAYSMLPARCV